MSMLLPSERLSSLSFWVSEFIRSPELCDRSLSLLVELALLPSPRGSFMSMPLPSRRLSFLTLRNSFSALQSSSWVELALLPSPQRVTYEHAAPLWASEFPLILGNECSVLQSLLSVELGCSPHLEGHVWAYRSRLSVWVSSHSEEWVLRPPELVLVELALLPSSRGSSMSRPLPSGRLSPLTLRDEFSALRAPHW